MKAANIIKVSMMSNSLGGEGDGEIYEANFLIFSFMNPTDNLLLH